MRTSFLVLGVLLLSVLLLSVLLLGSCAGPESLPEKQGQDGEAKIDDVESPKDRLLRVAACQILVDGDREQCLARVEAVLQELQNQEVDIVCFPEACLFGWVNPNAHELADAIPGETTARLGSLAKRFGVMIALGMAEKAAGGLYNSVVLIDRDGTLVAHHRKNNVLPELMDPPYSAGQDLGRSVAETRFGKIGLLICADTFQEDIVNAIGDEEPDLLLIPYGWAAPAESWPGHAESLHSWIAHTAKKTHAHVVGVNSVGELGHGPWKGYHLGGQSAWSDPSGTLSTPLGDRISDVQVFEFALVSQ